MARAVPSSAFCSRRRPGHSAAHPASGGVLTAGVGGVEDTRNRLGGLRSARLRNSRDGDAVASVTCLRDRAAVRIAGDRKRPRQVAVWSTVTTRVCVVTAVSVPIRRRANRSTEASSHQSAAVRAAVSRASRNCGWAIVVSARARA